MKKRFSEEQIIGFLGEAVAGSPKEERGRGAALVCFIRPEDINYYRVSMPSTDSSCGGTVVKRVA